MPPHCDTMDGPVVTAAKKALETEDVKVILPWAYKKAEIEIKKAFEKAMLARKLGKEAKEVADLWFYETVVRLHRYGEGAPYTGLKPAGLSEGPVLPLAEDALETGNPKKLIDFLSECISKKINEKLKKALSTRKNAGNNVESARENVEAMLGLELWSHHLYKYIEESDMHAKKKEEHED